jgi:hypothetical protein
VVDANQGFCSRSDTMTSFTKIDGAASILRERKWPNVMMRVSHLALPDAASPSGTVKMRYGRTTPNHERGMVLNLFYEDKDDRWFPGDRHIRQFSRRLLCGKPRINGQLRVFLNLCAGLDKLGIPYRVNDYGYIEKHPEELACIIGRSFVLDRIKWKNPILLGVAIYNHPLDDPGLFDRLPVKTMLVPGGWYAEMFKPYWPNTVVWPVGIDTETWAPSTEQEKTVDVLLYDKIHWDRGSFSPELLEPIRAKLSKEGRSFFEIRYGHYNEEDYQAALSRCRAVIFLCQHESQGIAYQQALSCDVPVFAWDPGGAWKDPGYFPHKVRFEPVSSVPYWDDRCGMKFVDIAAFKDGWQNFWKQVETGGFKPREYILDNLTLEKQARQYYEIARGIMRDQQRNPAAEVSVQ